MPDHVMDTDRVRALFVEADTFGTNDAEVWAESAAAFDAWLRDQRAQVLREAADRLDPAQVEGRVDLDATDFRRGLREGWLSSRDALLTQADAEEAGDDA